MSAPGVTGTSGDDWVSPVQQQARLAVRIAEAALTVDDVAQLSAGTHGRTGTFVGNVPVPGVVVGESRVDLHLVARYGRPLRELTTDVARAVAPLVGGRALQITVEDVLLPGAPDDGTGGHRGGVR